MATLTRGSNLDSLSVSCSAMRPLNANTSFLDAFPRPDPSLRAGGSFSDGQRDRGYFLSLCLVLLLPNIPTDAVTRSGSVGSFCQHLPAGPQPSLELVDRIVGSLIAHDLPTPGKAGSASHGPMEQGLGIKTKRVRVHQPLHQLRNFTNGILELV